jgi:D-amino-acid dehydrogenase
MSKESVIIVGGGVVGLCSAYYLAKSGYKVTIIDKGSFTASASHCNAGMIVPSHFVPLAQPGMITKGIKWMFNSESPFYIKPRLSTELIDWGWKFYKKSTGKHVEKSASPMKVLNLESKRLYDELLGEFDNFPLHKKGLIMYCKTQKTLDEEIELAEHANRIGLKAEALDKKGLEELDPDISIDVAGGVFFPEDAFLTPGLFLESLIAQLKKLGVEMIPENGVEAFEVNGSKIAGITTATGRLTADHYVIAAGAWSKKASKNLKINIPLLAGKGYSFTVPKPVQMPGVCSILTEAKVAVTPMEHGLRFAGTMEIGGLDTSINQKRVNGIKKSISAYFPEFKLEDFEGLEVLSGLRPCSPDGLPYIGKARAYDNLVVATGHGMMGMSMGPVTGHIVSQLINGEQIANDISVLDVDRFN